jgi:hypothetical protein
MRSIRLFILIAIVLFISNPVCATLLLEETFSYSVGPIAGNNGGTGFTAAWSDISGTGSVTANGKLQITDTGGHHDSPPERQLSMGLPADGQSIYFGYQLQTGNSVPIGGWIYGFAGSNLTFLWVGIDNGLFGVNGGTSTTSVASNTIYNLVARLTRVDAGSDILTLWIDPISEADSPVISNASNYINSTTVLSRWDGSIPSGSTSAGSLLVDNICAGATFNDVNSCVAVHVPEPTTLALMGLGLAGIGYRRRRSRKDL